MNRTARILIISFLALLSIQSNAQNPFTTYSNFYFKNEYVIYIGYSGSKRPPSPDEIDHPSPDENDQVSPVEVDHLI